MTREEFIKINDMFKRLVTAWTGKIADEVWFVTSKSPVVVVPHSELAMHTRIAGLHVLAFAIWSHRESGQPDWVQVLTVDNSITDGNPTEVLPVDFVNRIQRGDKQLNQEWDIKTVHYEIQGDWERIGVKEENSVSAKTRAKGKTVSDN